MSASNYSATPLLAAAGRVLLAAIFLISGFGKLADPGGTQAYIAAAGLPVPVLAYLLAVAIEVGGGVLLVIGYQTRIVALVIAGFSIVAALGFHHNFADMNQTIHFLKNIAMAGGLLQVAAFGAGSCSLDGRRVRGGTQRLATQSP
jgi:putative oxidoreductase